MDDLTLGCSRVVADVVTTLIDKNLECSIYRVGFDQSVVIEIDNYPLWESESPGSVYIMLKRNTFYRKGRNIVYKPLDQFSIRLYQERLGRQFAHPHIYPTGQPDWGHSKVCSATDLIVKLIETLTLQNVDGKSLQNAGTSSPVLGRLSDVMDNVVKHRESISKVLSLSEIIFDHSALKEAVNKLYRRGLIKSISEIIPDWSNIYEVNIEAVSCGSVLKAEINAKDSPMRIICNLYHAHPEAITRVFSNQRVLNEFIRRQIDEERSVFDLISIEGESISADWNTPLCNQLFIKNELERLYTERQVPVIVVLISERPWW